MGQGIQEWPKYNFLKAVFRKFYLAHSWIPRPICAFHNSVVKEAITSTIMNSFSVKFILSTTKMLLVGSAFNKSENCRPVLFLKEKYCQNVSIEFNCFGVYVSKQSRCFFLRLHYSLIKFHTFLVDREHQRNHHFHERYLHLKPMSNYWNTDAGYK